MHAMRDSLPSESPAAARWARPLWLMAGVACLLLGLLGLLLPLLPGVPFLLLAAFCFSRGSPRLEAWLDKRRQACASVVPPGSPLDRGLVQPLVRDNARGDYKRVSVSVHYLWPLLARSSWTGVDLNDAAAVQRVYDAAVDRYRALNP